MHRARDAALSQPVHHHVGGRVVADYDHQRQQIAYGRRQAVLEEDEDAAGEILLGRGQLPAIVEREAALIDLAKGLDQHGDLEHAAHGKDAPGVDLDPLIGLQMSGADAHLGAAVLDDFADIRFKRHKLFLTADGAIVHPGYGMKFLR